MNYLAANDANYANGAHQRNLFCAPLAAKFPSHELCDEVFGV